MNNNDDDQKSLLKADLSSGRNGSSTNPTSFPVNVTVEPFENVFLDDMIRSSRDGLLRNYETRKKYEESSKNNRKSRVTRQNSAASAIYRRYRNKNSGTGGSFYSRCTVCLCEKPCSFCSFLSAHFGLILSHSPKLAICLLILFLSSLVILFQYVVEQNKFDHNRVIGNDYTEIKSIYDLKLGKIDHWCLQGDDDSCLCEDPLEPTSRGEHKRWVKAHNENVEIITELAKSQSPSSKKSTLTTEQLKENMIDVVFVGESLVEEWAGRNSGIEDMLITKNLFQERFNKTLGAQVNGVAVGISGDTAPNVLWRLRNGEIGSLKPKVWWLVVGTNDLAMRQCSEEVVLLGILRVIEEIMDQRPDAHIVVNSILPMTLQKDGFLVSPSHVEFGYDHTHGMESSFFSNDSDESSYKTDTTDDTSLIGKDLTKKDDTRRRNALFSFKRSSMLWPSVLAINRQLKSFCDKNDKVSFFDSDEIFIDKVDGSFYIKSDLINNRGKVSKKGHIVWLEKILKFLDEISD